MFEFDKYDPSKHRDAGSKPGDYTPVENVERISFLVWGEHCVECAAPACFSTCDLYEPRPDQRCRRFVYGAYRNEHFASLRGYGAEIEFKKWAKIEARGNTRMEPIDRVLAQERRTAATLPLLNGLGKAARAVLRDFRWNHLTHSMLERKARKLHAGNEPDTAVRPEAFLVEVYNPGRDTIRMQLTMQIARNEVDRPVESLPAPFTTTLEFAPGYNKVEIDAVRFHAVTGAGLPFDIAMIPEADSSARLVFLTADFVVFGARQSGGGAKRPDIKCVVFDLDNTLWDGVLLENPDVQLRDGVADTIKALDERGILVSLVSKNDFDHAWARVEALGLAEYFLYPQINWMPKSQNLKAIADRLNINIDTFAFVDDNPFELEEVAVAVPVVEGVPVEELGGLLDRPRFGGSSSVEAKQRRQFYKDAIEREERQTEFGEDYMGFLRSCEIKLEIRRLEDGDFARVSELVQRTNQLNFSGRKYTREQLTEFVTDDAIEKFVLKCADRFGSYGTVGFSLVKRADDAILIDDFMLSCRVQGKFIEQALFHYLMTEENPAGVTHLRVNYRKTERNTPAWNVLNALNFVERPEGGVALDVAAHPLTCDFIAVNAASVDV